MILFMISNCLLLFQIPLFFKYFDRKQFDGYGFLIDVLLVSIYIQSVLHNFQTYYNEMKYV